MTDEQHKELCDRLYDINKSLQVIAAVLASGRVGFDGQSGTFSIPKDEIRAIMQQIFWEDIHDVR